jgi:hypothetical protein
MPAMLARGSTSNTSHHMLSTNYSWMSWISMMFTNRGSGQA